MKILIITQWFYPEPDLKGLTFAKELKRQGHEVQALTGFPNYPGGKVYPGYKIRLLQKENIDGIEVIRVPLYPSHNNSSVKRIINYLSFAFSAAFFGVLFVRKADVAYVYHPPATISIAAIAIKLFRRIPLVYDIQDLWPDTLKATGMFNNVLALKVLDTVCKLSYKLMNKIMVLSPGFKRVLKERGVKDNKIEVIYNWSNDINEPGESEDELKNELGLSGKFVVIFAGTMGKAQALESVLEAAKELKSAVPDVRLVFIGGGIEIERLKEIKKNHDLANVIFYKRVPPHEVGKMLKAADVLLVHLKNDPLFEITIPSKTQAYMRIGKPILMCVNGDARKMIEETCSGVYCEPENIQQFVSTVIRLYKMDSRMLKKMGENGKKYYESNLSIEIGTNKVISLFETVLN